MKNVLGKKRTLSSVPSGHDGASGHALENLFGLVHNRSSSADFGKFELKISSPKTTLGDWGPDLGKYSIGKLNPRDGRLGKEKYLNDYGQRNKEGKLHVTGPFYFREIHERTGLTLDIRNENIMLWDTIKNFSVIEWSQELMKKRIFEKFGSGIVVVSIENNTYSDLDFYLGFDFNKFLSMIRQREVIYDPGTSIKRPYSQFRFRSGVGNLVKINYTFFLKQLKQAG